MRHVDRVETLSECGFRKEASPLDAQTVDGIIRMLMEMNAKLDLLIGEEGDDVWEDEP